MRCCCHWDQRLQHIDCTMYPLRIGATSPQYTANNCLNSPLLSYKSTECCDNESSSDSEYDGVNPRVSIESSLEKGNVIFLLEFETELQDGGKHFNVWVCKRRTAS
ncbi:hypothetical protein EGW08_015963 [Elysia chlorotica]|uniref:Uncharacterized protein n=1 Tax=Elysia chlorotica TaxID=188477 RepID=A0A3S1BW08_ELYCH|nr:hypothetical protein EGW08_015963 [Elysia chlorotica]